VVQIETCKYVNELSSEPMLAFLWFILVKEFKIKIKREIKTSFRDELWHHVTSSHDGVVTMTTVSGGHLYGGY